MPQSCLKIDCCGGILSKQYSGPQTGTRRLQVGRRFYIDTKYVTYILYAKRCLGEKKAGTYA
jgi:hypothetical protein